MPSTSAKSDKIKKNFKKIKDLFENREYFYGLGRRKGAVAQVRIYPEGKGRIYINKKEHRRYFPFFEFQKIITKALDLVKEKQNVDLSVKVQGGGVRGQAEAISLGIARALVKWNIDNKDKLKQVGLLTRDDRVKERKKPGLKGARRAPQWQKR
jgi:small subunit ribosomal protein S9